MSERASDRVSGASEQASGPVLYTSMTESFGSPGDPVPVEPRLSLPDDRERKLAKEVKEREGGTLMPEEDDDEDWEVTRGGE